MADEIRPALTPEEWRKRRAESRDEDYPCVSFKVPPVEDYGRDVLKIKTPADLVLEPPDRHALAALALHGQPFGFTWEDVDELRENWSLGVQGVKLSREFADSLADRIAALLPPREERIDTQENARRVAEEIIDLSEQ